MNNYDLTNSWFVNSQVPTVWPDYLAEWKPERAIEIGSYEGASACYLIDNCDTLKEIYCVDTWEGSEEHSDVNMSEVEARFDSNIKRALDQRHTRPTLVKLKGKSHRLLSAMIDKHENYFDLVYIDGSHYAADVVLDASLSIHLLRPGGLMIFDDYFWRKKAKEPYDNRCPKLGIDAFLLTNNETRIDVLQPGYQYFIRKKV